MNTKNFTQRNAALSARSAIWTGLDQVARGDVDTVLAGKRIALLANQAAVSSTLDHAADILHLRFPGALMRIFAPEHGFRGAAQDMAAVGHAIDRITGLSVVSLYGTSEASLAPSPQQLGDIDVLVVDLPDIGTRYYTFAQTLGYCMRTAAATGTLVLVLDRPNPINGVTVEGAPLISECRSFCGYAPVPNRHGLTLGEIGRLMNHGFGSGTDAIPALGCRFDVVPVQGWSRDSYFDATGLPWVIPSPNMPTLDTALVYPGGCLFEATNASEGRGTTRPFEFLGAPFVHPERWIEATLNAGFDLKGARLRPISFQPQFHKHHDQPCLGVQIHIVERQTFQPFRWGLALVAGLARTAPGEFRWRADAYEFVSCVNAIDLLYGSAAFRELVEKQESLAPLEPVMREIEERFLVERREFLCP